MPRPRSSSIFFRTRPWRFGMVFFSATAIAQHYFWRDMAEATPGDPHAGRAHRLSPSTAPSAGCSRRWARTPPSS
ncbi:MAG: hypothetical protein R3D25_20245 [Geminicoccaceae bacterium]